MIASSARAARVAALFLFTFSAVLASVAPAWADRQLAREPLAIETRAGRLDFSVEIARTPQQKAMGLMFRRSLAPLTGMLFPYPAPDEVTMWMRNTLISLDMLFIDANGRIVRIAARTEPMSEAIISSGEPVTGVLEIAGGEAERLGIASGDRVLHSHFGTER